MASEGKTASAVISPCETYRYLLSRPGEDSARAWAPLVFIMLNPSTADARSDDPTIRRCRGFARDWGYNGLVVVKLFALRATDPSELAGADDPVGPENDAWLRHIAGQHPIMVAAWGANGPRERVEKVLEIINEKGAQLWSLGVTKAGAPSHPLYIPRDRRLSRWPETREQRMNP